MSEWLIPGLAGASAAAFVYSLITLLFSSERQVRRQLEGLTAYESGQAGHAEPLLMPFVDRVIKPASRSIAATGRLLAPRDYFVRVRQRLVIAGNPYRIEAEQLLALKVIGAAGSAVIVVIAGGIVGAPVGRMALAAAVAGAAGFFGPDIWLQSRMSARRLEIRRTLPDMLDMLTISVEAGMAFDAAVAKIVASRPGALSEEFGRMLQEIQAGISRRDALRALGERTDVPELRTFILAMIQADVFGVSVSNVLRSQSREMRIKRRQFAEEMAQKAPVKIVFPLILCILPATLIVVAGPAIVSVGRAFGLLGG
ncbi:MAG: type II secretion system F family protein [Clostridiales bacterium]|nr:type II secretion system F family protein [Clostridiales bacterium]